MVKTSKLILIRLLPVLLITACAMVYVSDVEGPDTIADLKEMGGKGLPKHVATRFREEYFEFLKTKKQTNELRKLIQRVREIEHQLLKGQEQI